MIQTLIGISIPFIGTVIGSAFVFFLRHSISITLQKALLGFASGVMLAAAFWSLLIPSLTTMATADGMGKVFPTAVGFLLGMGFLLMLDYITPHLHLDSAAPEGPKSRLSRTAMLSLAVTIHNLPEGMAVGVVLAGAMSGDMGIDMMAALTMSAGIAIQNIPEGAIVAMPLHAAGNSKFRSFAIGSLSGAVEPLGAIMVICLSACILPFMPYMLAFAAGAMMYVLIEELIPESGQPPHSNLSTIGFAAGFVLMMVLDVVMG